MVSSSEKEQEIEVESAGVLTGWGWSGAAAKSTTSSGFSVTQTLIIFFTSFLSCPVLFCSLVLLLVCSLALPHFTYCLFSELRTAGSQREVSWQWGGGEVCACVCVGVCVRVQKLGECGSLFAKSFSSWDSSAKRPLGYGLNFPFSPLLSLQHSPLLCASLRESQNRPAAYELQTKACTAPKIVRVRKYKHLYTVSDGQMESVGGTRKTREI